MIPGDVVARSSLLLGAPVGAIRPYIHLNSFLSGVEWVDDISYHMRKRCVSLTPMLAAKKGDGELWHQYRRLKIRRLSNL
jgi:hypothetical protein